MVERLLFTCVLLVLIGSLGMAAKAITRYREQHRLGTRIHLPQLAGRPAILYFSTPHCSTCRSLQEPALQRLAERYDKPYDVLRVDATQEPLLTQRCGVLTVPTTVILDATGAIKAVNNGYASEQQLMAQLSG